MKFQINFLLFFFSQHQKFVCQIFGFSLSNIIFCSLFFQDHNHWISFFFISIYSTNELYICLLYFYHTSKWRNPLLFLVYKICFAINLFCSCTCIYLYFIFLVLKFFQIACVSKNENWFVFSLSLNLAKMYVGFWNFEIKNRLRNSCFCWTKNVIISLKLYHFVFYFLKCINLFFIKFRNFSLYRH